MLLASLHLRLLLIGALVATLGFSGCRRRQTPSSESHIPLMRDVTNETGITFVHTDGSSGRRYIMETVTCGLALFDYNNDDLLDIYFVNGAPLPGAPPRNPPPRNELWRNDGHWHFTNVTDQAGVGDTGFGMGVTVGDYDNDGWPDIFVNNYGPNKLYHNNGDGTFTDVTDRAGVSGGNRMGAGAAFLDYDNDGDLDLYVANYVKFTEESHRVHYVKGYPMYAGPRDFPPEPDQLYRNNGDGTFTDVSVETGIGTHAGSGMGIVCSDYDNDGDTDVFVLNDVAGNFLFRNDGKGHFEEIGLESGFAYNGSGDELGSMGIDCGDYDNDGWLDLFMTSYQAELPVLYRNLGNGTLEDVTVVTGAGQGCLPYVNRGTGLIDFNNDGWKDLFIACGHLQDNIDIYDDTTAYAVRNILLLNRGNGTFENVSHRCGDGLNPVYSSRGAVFGDLNNDGDIDIVVLNSREKPTIIRNDQRTGNHWVQITLHGTKSNRDAVGAKIKVVAGNLTQVDEVHSGRGYQSYWGPRLHFGLGRATEITRIEIHWPSGNTQVFEHLPVDRFLTFTEGESTFVSKTVNEMPH
ncbi:CRTAC1 family protein [Thermogutta sp.]|uniref:CRTAC1 family protein n=1 Tax=Thermogutta sp. TaxID=1962930 RepID=UPI0032204357